MATTLDRRALFATPVCVFELADAQPNAEIASRLTEDRQRSAGIVRSNVGGWHSTPELAQRDEPCFRELFQAIVDRVSVVVGMLAEDLGQPMPVPLRYDVHAWATIMGDGDYTTVHDHGDAHWSIVYYVDAGEPAPEHPDSGVLVLVDPRRGGRAAPRIDLFPSRFHIRPQTGNLVVFPAWLQHFVHAYRGTRPRIAISANLTMR